MDSSTGQQDAAIEQAMEWLLRREMAPADSRLERDFQHWLGQAESNAKAYASVQQTWRELGKIPVRPSVGGAGNVVQLPVHKPRRIRWFAAAAALAAACVLIVAFPMLHRSIVADYQTGVAELQQVSLPDGSVVHLDAGSAIAVDYGQAGRRVRLLAGEAFFEVTRDVHNPFSVVADEISVVVTGTAFSVRKTAATVDVAVQSGSVDVLHESRSDQLGSGDRLMIDRADKAVRRDRMAPESVAAWRSRKLVVHDTSFGDIVEVIGRYLPGMVIVGDESLNRRMITGVFDLTRPVEAMKTLATSQDASVIEVTPYLLFVSAR